MALTLHRFPAVVPLGLFRSLIGLTLALLAACHDPSPVRLGIVLDHDGYRGALLAAKDINDAGGVAGRRVELRILHGLSTRSARDAMSAAEDLTSDPSILAVVGHTNSRASVAAARVYNEHHLVQIAPTSTAPSYSDAGPYSFRMVASDIHQGPFLADVVLSDPSHPRTAILYVNDDYGRALHGTLVRSLAARAQRPVYEAPYAEGAEFGNVDQVARAIARTRPQLLIWLGRSPELQRLLPVLRSLIPDLRVLASDGFSNPRYTPLPPAALVGVHFVRFVDIDGPRATSARALATSYESRWHSASTDQFLLAYDAVHVLIDAIRAVGPNRSAIRDYLSGLGTVRPAFSGVVGPLTFDTHGDPPPVYYLNEVTPTGRRPVIDVRRAP